MIHKGSVSGIKCDKAFKAEKDISYMKIHVVTAGETVDGISAVYGIPSDKLIYDNQLVFPYQLAVGQALFISDGVNERTRNISVNGYAYPFISRWVLENTLPYLTELSIFSYGFTRDGYLIPPVLPVDWMIQMAVLFDTAPILTLTPFDESGNFSNILISEVVNNPAAKENLIQNLVAVVGEKGYRGVDIDFEYILKEDRDAFTQFVQEVTDTLNEYGYQVSVALAPKTSDNQPGLLYEGKDYRALGEAANHVLLMTYEWGYTYSMPMAVAPINKVRQVVEYALTVIPPEKINMGIPNYGYDWMLPYEKGVTKAETIGNIEAVRIAIENGAEIQYDEAAQTPFFTYQRNGVSHEVWFEDVRSISAKLKLIDEKLLRGAGYWQIMQLFRANWLTVDSRFYINKL